MRMRGGGTVVAMAGAPVVVVHIFVNHCCT